MFVQEVINNTLLGMSYKREVLRSESQGRKILNCFIIKQFIIKGRGVGGCRDLHSTIQ